jgi:hypothetical protein
MAMLRLTAQNSFAPIHTQATGSPHPVASGIETMVIATTVSCSGIKEAYPVLGAVCEKAYAKIDHNLVGKTCQELQDIFRARVNTMKVFRQAYWCNGMGGATKQQQEAFIRGENGHLQALQALENHMLGLATPCIPYDTVANITTALAAITIKKPQCK